VSERHGEVMSFESEMFAVLEKDKTVAMEGTLRRQEKARWHQGFKTGARNERNQLRDELTAAMCGFGQTGCKCVRCEALVFAMAVVDGREAID
jgi:hypothetical protein